MKPFPLGLALVLLATLIAASDTTLAAAAPGRSGGSRHGGGMSAPRSNAAFAGYGHNNLVGYGHNNLVGYGHGRYGLQRGFGYGYGSGFGYGYGYPFFDDFGFGSSSSGYAQIVPIPVETYATWNTPVRSGPQGKLPVAEVQIFMIDPNGEVWVNGVPSGKTGQQRDFITPELAPGKVYTYDIRAKWTQHGQTFEKARTVQVQAGQEVGISFFVDDREVLPPPTKKQ